MGRQRRVCCGRRGGDRVPQRLGPQPRSKGSRAEQVEATASATTKKVEAAEPDKAEATAVSQSAGRRPGVIGGESIVHFVC